MDYTPHALDYVSVLRRRKWWLVIPIALAVIGGVIALQVMPKEYRATALLGVAAPEVSPSLVNQSAVIDSAERLRAITHQLRSENVLMRVVREEGLAPGGDEEAVVNRLRRAVDVSVPDPVARNMADARFFDAFQISFVHDDPAQTQRVTNRLATVFIDEVAKRRASTAEKSTEYLAAERDKAQARLNELEGRLRQAKEAYMGRLPEQTGANLSTLTSLRQQLEMNGANVRHQQDRLSMLERQIETIEQQAANGVTTSMSGAADPIAALERDLAAARTLYTEKHPEVQRLEAELAKALAAPAKTGPRGVDARTRLQMDPTYRQLQGDREATRLALRDLEHAAQTLRTQIADYQRRVEVAPMIEQQLASVQREYDLAQKHYADASARYTNALMAQDIARNQDGERFAMILPAAFPQVPEAPVPARVMLIALVVGITLGGALALAREYFDRSVYSVHDVADDVDLPVLGEVAHIPSASR